MKISFIITGEEIISGFRQDKNFSYASKILYEYGFSVHTQFVGDRKEDFMFALECAEKFSDIIVCSGGLGSTSDDLTRFVAAEYFGVELQENPEAIEHIRKKIYERSGRLEIPEPLRLQATFPKGAEPIFNEKGSAPGFKIERQGKSFFFLPGVPTEFQDMFSKYVITHIEKSYPHAKKKNVKVFKIFGITETYAEKEIESIGIPKNVKVSYFPSFPELTIRIYGDEIEDFSEKVKEKLREHIYSESDSETFNQVVGEILKRENLTISTAESLTGGELANMLTDIPGSSLYFRGSQVVYHPEAKLKLGVKRETIEKFGTVSEQCAKELSEGVREYFGSDIGISTTGVAGPDSIEGKPAGLFYIGFSTKNSTEAFEFRFNVGRKNVKILCSYLAMKILKDKIKDTSKLKYD